MATPISVQNFRAIVETKEVDGRLNTEYQTLPHGAVHPHEEGKKEFNVPKNRFISTFPYDHSRVILTDRQSDPGSDYINANYIDGVSRPKAYIALQGPKKKTVEAFWTMIWQQKCHTIVMLTNLYENGRNKCHQYWPDVDDPLKLGAFSVHLNTEKEYAFYVKRVMVLKHRKKNQERLVCQFHYTKWPDHGIPDVFELVMFHRHIQRSRIPEDGPLAVHCSAGIGRTGTLIALDSLLEAGKKNESIDVHGYVLTMRKDRMNMVQTVDQYRVIHLALIEGFTFPDNIQTKEDLISYEEPGIYVVPANQTQRNKEYQTLQDINTTSAKRLKYETAKSADNRAKNRDMEILPADNYKAPLFSEMPTGNYINAVKVPGFRNHLKYLVTQFPLRDTIMDFWTLVTDFSAKTIVCLEEFGSEKEIQWWPEKSMVKYAGTFEVRTVSADTCTDDINASLLNIKDKKNDNTHYVKLFQVRNWAKDASIPTSESVLCKLHYLVEAWLMSKEEGPVVVTCLDGANHSGLYCLISTMLERLDSEADVDMYATTRQLQIRRPQFIATLDQYRYAWTALKAYIQTTGNDECAEEAVYQNTS
ncbi:receptor-type tyrosine-protein phosphatase kappa-like [Pecten maximus]|uniref:receptor-type tyrosine-protein phosphatase kappa-like n=1 Tax=Pecten maximus TaxID=6579 RepID=UPI001458902F|nr:receptor-type tyrosine-protein phosphatase kappa-like [Pecten maximus]